MNNHISQNTGNNDDTHNDIDRYGGGAGHRCSGVGVVVVVVLLVVCI